MLVEVLEHDVQKGAAKLKFTHNDVTFTSSYDLKMVIPGTDKVLVEYGLDFTEEMQQIVIDKLTQQVQRDIDAGILHNPI